MLSSDDNGRDLVSVQTLQRKHEGIERDLAALEDKVYFGFNFLNIQFLLKMSLIFLFFFLGDDFGSGS